MTVYVVTRESDSEVWVDVFATEELANEFRVAVAHVWGPGLTVHEEPVLSSLDELPYDVVG